MKEKIEFNQLKSVTDYSDTGIHVVDKNGITIYYNKSQEKIDGINSKDMIGRSMKELVDDGTFSKSLALEALETKEESQSYQFVNDKYIFARAVPVFEEKSLSFVIVYTRDFQTLKNLSIQLDDIKRENERMARELSGYKSKYSSENLIVNNNKEMNKIVKLAKRISALDSPVLITGEPGTGKTLFAQYIHDISGRTDKAFVKFDCSAIPEKIMEEELFGSFKLDSNGCIIDRREGFLEKAYGGTIFIDEIADMPVALQLKLSDFLKTGIYTKSSSSFKHGTNVRIIAASNENLKKLIDIGKFRGDLYYSLSVIDINIPPLRSRKEDIAKLANIHLDRFNYYYGMDKKLSPSAIRAMLEYHWPGNVRELENTIERLVVTTEEDIEAEDFIKSTEAKQINYSEDITYKEKVDEYEISLINYYASISESIKDMAQRARINESTLRKKIERYSLDISFLDKY